MPLRLPKAPLVISALLALAGAIMFFVVPMVLPEFEIVGVGADLVGIGILGFAFLVFALSFALATPIPQEEREAAKAAKAAAKAEREAARLAEADKEIGATESKYKKRAEKAAAKLAAKAEKEAKEAAKEAARLAAIEAKEAAKAQEREAKAAIKAAKEAERKRRNEDDDDDASDIGISFVGGEEYVKPLSKEEQEELKEDARLAKERAKAEAEFSREAQKQAKIAAKLAEKEAKEQERLAAEQAKAELAAQLEAEKAAAKQAKIDEREAAKQAKIDAKAAAIQAKLDAKEAKRIAKKNRRNGLEDLEVEYAAEYVAEPVEMESTSTDSSYESAPVNDLETADELDEVVTVSNEDSAEELTEDIDSEVSTVEAFSEPELVLPTDEEIYGLSDEEVRIPFSNKARSKEVKALEEELLSKLDILNDKIALLERQIENTK